MKLLLSFSLDDLRARFPATAGVDPRHDTGPFRAFRAALLDAFAARAIGSADISFSWEGTFNGYSLVVIVDPADAIPGAADAAPYPPEAERVAPSAGDAGALPSGTLPAAAPPPTRYPLGRVAPGEARVARDAEGAALEAPFGAPTGHFGAPGVRRIR